MTKRRAKGEGTIYRRKSDGRWVGMYTVSTLDGVTRRAVYGKSKNEVRLKLTEAIADRDKGLVFDSGNLSVGEYLDRWLDAVQDTIGERTWKRHESIVRLHIAPAIGATKLAALTPLQVQSLYRAKSKSHLAPGSVKRIHTTLHKAMRQAVRWQMIPRNPCDSVDAPKGYRGEIKPLDKEQVRTLLTTAKEMQPRLYALYVLGVTTGMRQSELIGLQWSDLDFGVGRLTVKRSVFKGKISTPKTARGSRTVRLTRLAVDALIRHKNEHKTSALWVFATRNGTTLDCSNFHCDYWRRLIEHAGLPRVSFHAGTRHTCATLLLGQGVHPKLVADLLGHASIKTTLNIYSSVMPSMQDGVADAIEDALGGGDTRHLGAL
jgi:integrase